jgi:hypothetical protein
MSLASLIGLNALPPELSKALTPVIEQLETHLDTTIQTTLKQVETIVGSALDRIDGAQIVVVCTVKLPQSGSQIAGLL